MIILDHFLHLKTWLIKSHCAQNIVIGMIGTYHQEVKSISLFISDKHARDLLVGKTTE